MTCKGTKRVATLRYGTGPFEKFVGQPLLMTPKEAVAELEQARARELLRKQMHRRGNIDISLIESAIRAIGEAGCPTCRGTGSSFEMRQLTPEEAEKLR